MFTPLTENVNSKNDYVVLPEITEDKNGDLNCIYSLNQKPGYVLCRDIKIRLCIKVDNRSSEYKSEDLAMAFKNTILKTVCIHLFSKAAKRRNRKRKLERGSKFTSLW